MSSGGYGYKLYKLSFASGVLLAAPLLVAVLWYAWSAYATLDRYRRALDPKEKIDLELFQVVLHDELRRDLRWLDLPERPAHEPLPTYALSLPRASLDQLQLQLRGKAPRDYVPALVEKDRKVRKGAVRPRGDQPWHTLGAQKSLKIELEKGELIDGVRVFNLINDPTPFGLEDELILDLARELDLLAPEFHPVRVRLNNTDMGVYRFESQPDETLLRVSKRMPGDMYSGESKGDEGVFTSTTAWRKIASRSEAHENDHAALHRLIDAVNGASYGEFADYATRTLDLDRYARFGAIDVVFAGSEHDYLSNHRFYVDPYRGRIEPVAWSFRGFQQDDHFDSIDHPLLLRLKAVPGWLARRDREVYALLTDEASVPAIRARAERAMARVAGELAADPHWDAYKLLPRATRLHRFLVRPMTLDRWALGAQHELLGFAARSRWLLDELDLPGLTLTRGPSLAGGVHLVTLQIEGHAAYAVRELRAACAAEVFADVDLDGRFDPARDRLLADARGVAPAPLFTARIGLVSRPDASPKRGPVRAELVSTRYDLFVRAEGCTPALILESAVTGASTRVELGVDPSAPAPERSSASTVDRRFALVEGELSPHPWSYAWPVIPIAVTLGPGRVELPSSRSFDGPVEIAAGTTLALGPDASLVFEGKVTARGTASSPIVVERLDPTKPFGGLAVQGMRAAGSSLVEVVVRGGTHASSERVDYPALINVHDSADIELDSVRISDLQRAEDAIHVNAVERVALHEIHITGAPVDGVDIEMSSGELRGVRVSGAGDDCLDLMGATLRVSDSVFTDCTSNGVSAGEQTDLSAVGLVVARAKTGVLAKNASEVRLIRALIQSTEKALKAKREEVRYGGPSRIGTSEVYVVDAKTVHDADKGSTIELDSVSLEAPRGALAALLEGAP